MGNTVWAISGPQGSIPFPSSHLEALEIVESSQKMEEEYFLRHYLTLSVKLCEAYIVLIKNQVD